MTELAVFALLFEVPVWTVGTGLLFVAPTAVLRVIGLLAGGGALAALIGSTFVVRRFAARDQVVLSERRRAVFRGDLAAARAARDNRDAEPDERADASAVLAEDDVRAALAGVSDAELHDSLRGMAWPDPDANRAVIDGRWADVLARSVELRSSDPRAEPEWHDRVARLDEAWFRAGVRTP